MRLNRYLLSLKNNYFKQKLVYTNMRKDGNSQEPRRKLPLVPVQK
jgi:hypothetical protein